jgi:superfamily I DNA/RNA helicase
VADSAKKRVIMRRALAETGYPLPFAQAMKAIGRAKTLCCELDFERVYVAYEKIRRQMRLFDFEDMLVESLDLLREGRVVPHWKHILVDEAQDTDPLQWMLIRAMVGPETQVFIVGDISQSIYGFRGAVPMEMLDGVDLEFGAAVEQIELPCNYRSVGKVVELANETVRGRPGALTLQAVRQDHGEVRVQVVSGMRDAASKVLAEVQQGKRAFGDHAILYRTNACAEAFENAFLKAGVPYVIAGDFSFYSRMEIMDALAYLELSQGWNADAADRVYNKPSRYLGAAWRAELERQGGWQAVAEDRGMRFSRDYMRRNFDGFVFQVVTLQQRARDGARPAELIRYALYTVGYRAWLLGEQPDDADEVRAENLEMLMEAVEDVQSVRAVLELAEKCRKNGLRRDPPKNAVQLMTVHRAKGLEWPVVYLAGCDRGLMPHRLGESEEERRIAYVAFTRARDQLVVLTTQGSEFIDHLLPKEEDEDEAVDASPATGFSDCEPERDAEDADDPDDALGRSVRGVRYSGGDGVADGEQRLRLAHRGSDEW